MKLRVLHVLVQPVLVWDDGDELTPGPATQPTAVSVAQLVDAPKALAAEVARLQDDFDQQSTGT